jgi:hypothetical protein
MTDAELIARLRENQAYEWQDPIWETRIAASDRIEQLVATNEALEAKLAKAVEAMRETLDAIEGYNQTLPDEDGLYWDGANAGLIAQEIVSARATLAEIKGAINE